jgi:uncharacterized coiled-coil protein SlyX
MKKDQLNRVKDTKNSSINQTFHFSSFTVPKFKNVKEAEQFIAIQQGTISHLEKDLSDYKGFLESTHESVSYWMEKYKESKEKIKRLELGDIDDNAYEELKSSLKEQEVQIEQNGKEIKELKNEIKKAKSYSYRDFIMN